jgi:hypothetical protein
MEGAMQQAPQWGRQSIGKNLYLKFGAKDKKDQNYLTQLGQIRLLCPVERGGWNLWGIGRAVSN